MDAYGVATWLPYTRAEFKVLAGEGQCDTGQHSSKRNKRKSGERGGGSETSAKVVSVEAEAKTKARKE
jgi:hypothetical protein